MMLYKEAVSVLVKLTVGASRSTVFVHNFPGLYGTT